MHGYGRMNRKSQFTAIGVAVTVVIALAGILVFQESQITGFAALPNVSDEKSAVSRTEAQAVVDLGFVILNSSTGANISSIDNLTVYTDQDDNASLNLSYDWFRYGRSHPSIPSSVPYSRLLVNLPWEDYTKDGDIYDDYSEYRNHMHYLISASVRPVWSSTIGHDGGGAFQFDGSNDYRAVRSTNELKNAKNWTVSIWAKSDTSTWLTGNRYILERFQTFTMYGNSGTTTVTFGAYVDNAYRTTSVAGFTITDWHHYVGTYDGTNVKLWVDGTQYSSSTAYSGEITEVAAGILFGRQNTGLYYFDGALDEILIFDTALNQTQIEELQRGSRLVQHGQTQKDDIWSVNVTPDDGSISGNAATSNTVEILNNAPSLSTVILNSTLGTNISSTDNLTAFASGESDPDGDNVTLFFTWFINGRSHPSIPNSISYDNVVVNRPFENYTDELDIYDDYTIYGNDQRYLLPTSVRPMWSGTLGHDGYGAFVFDGSNDYLYVANSDSTKNTQNVTVSVWAKSDTETFTTGNRYIIHRRFAFDMYGAFNDKRVYFAAYVDSAYRSVSYLFPESFNLTEWHHYVGTYNGTHVTLWIDGTEFIASTPYSGEITPIPRTTFIGRPEISLYYWDGIIDDVLILNTGLDATQVQELHEGGRVIPYQQTNPGDNWTVSVTPDDGVDEGPTVNSSTSVAIINNPPSVSTVILNSTTGSNISSIDNLTAFTSGESDPDGDNVTLFFTWFIHGRSHPSIPRSVRYEDLIVNLPFDNYTKDDNRYDDYSIHENDIGFQSNTALIPSWSSTAGHDGNGAFQFDGSNDYLYLFNSDTLRNMSNLTISIWAKSDTETFATGNRYIIHRRFAFDMYGALNDKRLYFGVYVDNGYRYANFLFPWSFNLTEWHHYVGTYNGTHIKLYVDGTTYIASGAYTGSITPIARTTFIGRPEISLYYWDGALDDVLIFNRTLNETEIEELHEGSTLVRAQQTSTGDNWSVSVEPFDIYELNGTAITADSTVVIANNPPSIANITLTPIPGTNLSSIDNLSVTADGRSDPDGDIVNLTFNWYINNKSYRSVPRSVDYKDVVLDLPFENFTRDTDRFDDHSIYGNDIRYESNAGPRPTFNPTGGHDGGGAFEFDGSNDYLFTYDTDRPSSDSIRHNPNITVAIWAKSGDTLTWGGDTYLIDKRDDYSIYGPSATKFISWSVFISGAYRTVRRTPPQNFNISEWHHYVGTYDGNKVILYIDGGELVGSISYSGTRAANTRRLEIGRRWNGLWFKGALDEVMIINRSLTASEVKELFEGSTYVQYRQTELGDNWSASGTPHDQDTNGSTIRSNSVEILNNPPNLTAVILNSTTGSNLSSTDNLTAFALGASDPENDSVKLIFEWFRNGRSYPGVPSSVPYRRVKLNLPFENYTKESDIQKDYSLYDNLFTYQAINRPTWLGTGGMDGYGAYSFDGSNDYLQMYDADALEPRNITISFWMKHTNPTWSGERVPLGKRNSYYFYGPSGTKLFRFYAYINGVLRSASLNMPESFNFSEWHHYAGTYNGSRLTLWIDAKYRSSPGYVGNVTASPYALDIGRKWNGFYFKGELDELMILDKALNESEISDIYNHNISLIQAEQTDVDDQWSVKVTPNDGFIDGPTKTSSTTVGILNNPPTISSVHLNATSIYNITRDNLTAYALGATDPDSDDVNISYDWYLNGRGWNELPRTVNYSDVMLNMPFEKYNSTTTNLTDYSLNRHNVSFLFEAVNDLSAGHDGHGAYFFDGLNDYMTIPDSSTLETPNITISFWMKHTNDVWSGDRVPLGKRNSYYFYGPSGTKLFRFYAYINGILRSASYGLPESFNLSEWHHYAGTYNGSRLVLLIDGKFRSAPGYTGSVTASPYVLDIGRKWNGFYFKGHLDDLVILDRALNITEIREIANKRITIIRPDQTSEAQNWTVNATPNDGIQDGSVVESNLLTVLHDDFRPTIELNYPPDDFIAPIIRNNITFNFTVRDNFDVSMNCSFFLNGTLNQTVTETNNTVNSIPLTNLSLGNYTWNVTCTDSDQNFNASDTRTFRVINIPPETTSTAYTPSDHNDVDPGVNVTFNATVVDFVVNVSEVRLKYHNGTEWRNKTMGPLGSDIYQTSIILSAAETNYTFNIWANNTLGLADESANQSFESAWDCSWNATPTFLGATAGFSETKDIGDILINNTGDPQFGTNNCSLDFRLTYDLDEGRLLLDGKSYKPSDVISIDAKSNQTIDIDATFLNKVKEETATITVNEISAISENASRNITAVIISTTGGPYLFQLIEAVPGSVVLTLNNFSLSAYVRNVVGDGTLNNTAFNVSLNWSLPSGFSVSEGNATLLLPNVSGAGFNYNNLTITFDSSNLPSLSPGRVTVITYAKGFNLSGGQIVHTENRTVLTEQANITLLCFNESDGVVIDACGSLDGDFVAPSGENITVTQIQAVGGGGGGPGRVVRGPTRIVEVPPKIVKVTADLQLVRGQQDELVILFENKDPNRTMTDIGFSVTGNIARYIDVEPSYVSFLRPGEAVNVRLVITSPKYLLLGREEIILTIKGLLDGQQYIETRDLSIEIHELSDAEAEALLQDAIGLVGLLKAVDLPTESLEKLIEESKQALAVYEFEKVRENYETIRDSVTKALNTKDIIEELEALIAEAQEKGIDVSNTERLLRLTTLALKREEFPLAFRRAQESQSAFALETKGEFGKLIYHIKQNARALSLAAVLLPVLLFVSFKLTRLQMLKTKAKRLRAEEVLLSDLMKTVQSDAFKKKKMSMDEYRQAMLEYEKRLSVVIEDLIRTENKRIGTLKFASGENVLKRERKRITHLIKQLQTDYLKKKKFETRSYNLRLESYNRRMGQIEERLATLEAKAALRKQLGIFRLFRRKK